MKVVYEVKPGAVIEVDGLRDTKQAFQFLAHANEIFGVKQCGQCDSPNLKLQHRQPKGYDFYSVKCKDCHYELEFGQTKEGNKLYPKDWVPPWDGAPRESDDLRPPVGEEEIPF